MSYFPGEYMSKGQKQDVEDNRSLEIVPQAVVEDEIDLVEYFLVLMKHKWLILLGTLVPTLVVGAVLFLQPKDYTVSYSYRMALGQTDLKELEDKFYSTENAAKLIEDLKARGLENQAQQSAAGNLKKTVTFEVSPPLFDTAAKTFDESLKRQDAKGTLLVMHLEEKKKDILQEAASVYRKNFEEIIPLYLEKTVLINGIAGYKRSMAGIEETRYTLNLQLDNKKITLDKLKKSGLEGPNIPGGIVLQFDNVGANSAYLPLSYQVQAAQTQIIALEENIQSNTEKYAYYADLLVTDEALLSRLDDMVRSHSSLGQFHAFLTDTLAAPKQDTPQIHDHLSAYIKRIENNMTAAIPLIENPMVYAAEKGTLKKTALVLVITFMLSLFGAFLREGLEKKSRQL